MRSTLFFIPHEFLGLPVLGFGWCLMLLALWCGGWMLWNRQRDGDWRSGKETLPVCGLFALLLVFVFPNIETRVPTSSGTDIILGMPVRGYGLMLMLGAIGGVALSQVRAGKLGLSVDDLLSLAFWTCGIGIAGARVFYVTQKWSELPGATLSEKLFSSLKFTEGGLVVYGGIIGGIIAILVWCYRRKKNPYSVLDLVPPGFMVGLGFGRIGCFLHGCCFGGLCLSDQVPSVRFPSGSEPYMAQVVRGELLGLRFTKFERPGMQEIREVEKGSWGEQVGLKKGQIVSGIFPHLSAPQPGMDPAGPQAVGVQLEVDGQSYSIPTGTLPPTSLPLHPAQLYSSVNAFLIASVLFFYWPIAKRHGYVLAGGLCLYAVARVIEEWIRVDEMGQFGTQFTIAQWISIFGGMVGLAIFYLQRNAARSDLVGN